ncbi:MAG: Ku protein, partial [Acidimicrobiia bacterium]
GALALTTMLFHDEVVPVSEINGIPTKRMKAPPQQVKMAAQIIESLTRKWDPGRYEDTYRIRVLEYIERKAEGEDIVVEEQAPEEEKVVDLMAALEASLAAARKNGSRKKRRSA